MKKTLILTLRTDQPEAELGLYDDRRCVEHYQWQAHRQLAETIHLKLQELLKKQKVGLSDLTGLVLYKGPGSFTGLRIGASVTNALADSLSIPVVSDSSEQWQDRGLERLANGENERIAVPEYGSEPKTTAPRK